MMPFNPRTKVAETLQSPPTRPQLDVEMAELFGIYAGDGCLAFYRRGTTTDYRLTVSGSVDDFEYLERVRSIVWSRFGSFGALKDRQLPGKKWLEFICRSKFVVDYFSKNGYLPGKKTDIGIPDWIRSNSEFSAAFIRGLFDTDGHFMLLPKGRLGLYPKFAFQFKPRRLILELVELLRQLGFSPSIYLGVFKPDPKTGRIYEKNYAYLNGWRNFLLWREKIGSSNPKNQARLDAAYAAFQGPVLKPSLAGITVPFELLLNRPTRFR